MKKQLSTLAAALVLATSANASVLSQYDGSDGALISATLTVSGFANYFGSMTKISSDAGAVSAAADVAINFEFYSPDNFAVNSALGTLQEVRSAGPDLLTPQVPNSFFDIFFELSLTDVDLASILGDLTGPDEFTVDCNILVANETYTGGLGGQVNPGSIDGSGCSASIKYVGQNSVPVPEPGTMALVGLALAGLGFARRRKSA